MNRISPGVVWLAVSPLATGIALIAVVLGNATWAAEAGGPAPTPLSPARGTALVEKALQAMGGAEEIVFAVRDLCAADQYYATFGE